MNSMKRMSTVALTAFVLWSCGEAPVAPERQTVTPPQHEPSFIVEHSGLWSIPQNLGPLVNTTAMEQHPALSKDGLSLYFASNRSTGDLNIWVARRACTDRENPLCAWEQPVTLGDAVNSEYLDASPTLSRDGHQLFFASQRSNGHCTATADDPCDRDLWVAYRENVQDDLGWGAPVNLGAGVNTAGEEVAPSYFENGDTGQPQLFFNDGVINAQGVLAGGNIYWSELRLDGTWGSRVPVDEPATDPADLQRINTTFSDQRASVSHDGRELYFQSSRPITPGGTGGISHIWVATRQSLTDPWSVPTLVASPISDVQTIHPFIQSHGRTETLLLVRSFDILMSERTIDAADSH